MLELVVERVDIGMTLLGLAILTKIIGHTSQGNDTL
jgi:hypothetical protein